jgi:hypothetical protein
MSTFKPPHHSVKLMLPDAKLSPHLADSGHLPLWILVVQIFAEIQMETNVLELEKRRRNIFCGGVEVEVAIESWCKTKAVEPTTLQYNGLAVEDLRRVHQVTPV